ncbi:MAG: YdcF family protein [Novosphingobium sp.]
MSRYARLGAFVVLAYLFGFLWFVFAMPQAAGDAKTDAIVVLTGGEGRIDRAIAMLRQGRAPRLFVAGVDKKVRPSEFAAQYREAAGLMTCCIVLDFKSTDTISNASEAAFWTAAARVHSVRLVTSDWHMRRAALELARVAPSSLVIVRDAVPSHPSFEILVLEYHKLLARAAGLSAG